MESISDLTKHDPTIDYEYMINVNKISIEFNRNILLDEEIREKLMLGMFHYTILGNKLETSYIQSR